MAVLYIVDTNLIVALLHIIFNPLFWNLAARLEYRTHLITKTIGLGFPRLGCYALCVTIVSLGVSRDYRFGLALESQPVFHIVPDAFAAYCSYFLYAIGITLVVSSTWVLGITGTFLGDYFGILMKNKVVGFPFNICSSPMYTGSVISFVAYSVKKQSPAGLFLSFFVYIVYQIALTFEDPFTEMIYAKKLRDQ